MDIKYSCRPVIAGTLVAVLFALAACSGVDVEHQYPRRGPDGLPTYDEPQSIFGEGGLILFQNRGDEDSTGQGNGIGVNSFLWRASLDTVAFMPIKSADPFGGVILTDWYAPPESVNERFKINIFILDRTLRSDGIRAKVLRQIRADQGDWVDTQSSQKLDIDLENAILTRARQLRIRTARPE